MESAIEKVERALGIDNLYDAAERPARQPPEPGAEGAGALPARRRLRRPGRRGQDRRRVHRPDHGRPPLVGGPPPGGRGEGRRADPGGARHARDDHAPELLPPLREARRHDRHREDRGEGVRRDLRHARRRDPDQPPVARDDENDFIYKTKEAKFKAVVDDIKERHEQGAAGPRRHDRGRDLRVPLRAAHARRDQAQRPEREGARARGGDHQGRRPAAARSRSRRTWPAAASTSSSARACVDLGGLYVLGTERHEARRIDNQLRGRSGRQGDPGESRFYLSAQDDLVRLFAGDRIYRIIDRFKIPDDQPMEAKILSRQIETAQKKVEEQNFVSRKNVLKYDDVMNKQRVVIYEQRRQVLEGDDFSEEVKSWIDEVVERAVDRVRRPRDATIDLDALAGHMQQLYGSEITADELREDKVTERSALVEEFIEDAREEYEAKEEELGSELMRELERFVILQVVDTRWREHLENMDYLREGVAPARAGPEGPARRVHGRGPRDVPGAERADPRGGARHALPCTARARGRRGAAAAQEQQATAGRERRALVRARAVDAGADAIAGALGGESDRRSAPSRRRSSARPARTRRSAATTRARAARARSSRSATAPSAAGPAFTDGVIRLEPLASGYVSGLRALCSRTPTSSVSRACRPSATRGFVAGWLGGLRRRAGTTARGPGSRSLEPDGGASSASCGLIRISTGRRQRPRSATSSRPRARGRGLAGRGDRARLAAGGSTSSAWSGSRL